MDFVAHVAIAFRASTADAPHKRVAQAVEALGVSIVSGAISTASVGACMTQCVMLPFARFGTFLVVSIGFSLLFALVLFPVVLASCCRHVHAGELGWPVRGYTAWASTAMRHGSDPVNHLRDSSSSRDDMYRL